ncbi:MAG TPA: hypothetical protein VG293_06960 [Solirubrobacteraceae bacterium]|nr:hypothetical protein [Solirubrobacteraceae bacterium]
MRTNNMIYQAAVAHQTELRRAASRYSATADRSSGRASWIQRFSHARSQQQSPTTAQRAQLFTRSASI